MNETEYKLIFEQGIDVPNRTIFLNTDISADTSNQVRVGLSLMSGPDPIIIDINSFGGSAVDGFCIYEMLIRHKKSEIITFNSGCAMSAALLIFMAGKKRLCLDHSEFMYHGPKDYTEFFGADFKSLEIASKDLKQMQSDMSELMAINTTKKKAFWTGKSKSDFTFKRKAALEMGVVTKE